MQASDARVLVLGEGTAARSLEESLRSAGYEDLHVSADLASSAKACRELQPELVLVDLAPPDFRGLDAIRAVTAACAESTVAVLSAPSDSMARSEALALGARDFVCKPLDAEEIKVRVANLLEGHALRAEAAHQTAVAAEDIRKRTTELWESLMQLEEARKNAGAALDEMLARLSMVAEHRDDETSGHVERMSRYCGLLAEATGADSETAEKVRLAGRLHDIGKIGVSDLILLKEATLSPAERQRMEQHVPIGVRLLEGSRFDVVQLAAVIAGSHHERWDGTGYPNGLAGELIPVEGRIAAIADVFDALTHTRPYRRAFPLGHVLDMLRRESGKHFDPRLLEAFLDSMNSVLKIYEEHRESA
ncbi:MAG TPA: HD domain-containing phosphohydrolase [Actinomycetota bacterium]|nr:HD domain-containing phosphohydrolase [Actinomycetota bacterium]